MKIDTAEFVVGAASPSQFPSSFLPEVAFAGKSNVGKSSLLNAILNRKKLVKTSGTPGKTRQLNFFEINRGFRCVDLPGYGFSRVSRAEKENWEKLVESYLREGRFLAGVVMIVDIRHKPSPLDLSMREWLIAFGLRHLIVANKVDKLKKSQVQSHLAVVRRELDLEEPPLAFSAKTRQGRDVLLNRLTEWIASPQGRQTHP